MSKSHRKQDVSNLLSSSEYLVMINTFTVRDLSLEQVESYSIDHMYTLALSQVTLYK